jgi:hypothetical protein
MLANSGGDQIQMRTVSQETSSVTKAALLEKA